MMGLTPAELAAIRLSLEVALRSVLMSLPPAILIAWILTRARFPGRTLLDAFVHLPLVLPPVAIGYMLLLLFGARGPFGGLPAQPLRHPARLHHRRRRTGHRGHDLPAHGARHAAVTGERRPRP